MHRTDTGNCLVLHEVESLEDCPVVVGQYNCSCLVTFARRQNNRHNRGPSPNFIPWRMLTGPFAFVVAVLQFHACYEVDSSGPQHDHSSSHRVLGVIPGVPVATSLHQKTSWVTIAAPKCTSGSPFYLC
jgi:hypothetical protein